MRQMRQIQRQELAIYDSTDRGEIDEPREGDYYSMPSERTDFWAGSKEKIEIMRKRLEDGEHLHHPFDCEEIIVDKQDPVVHSLRLNPQSRRLKCM